MYTILRNNRGILISLVLVGMLSITAYFCFRFYQLFQYVRIDSLTQQASMVLPAIASVVLVLVAARTRGFLLGYLIYLGGAYALGDVIRLLVRLLPQGASTVWGTIYCGGALPILLTCVLCVYGYHNARAIHVTPYTVKIAGLQEGLRIALISDMHLGAGRKEGDLARIVKVVNAQSPDVILLAGDIYEEKTTREQYDASAQAFAGFQAVYGVYYVPGNHEYAAVRNGTLQLSRMERALAGAGVRTLHDETVLIDGRLQLLGRRDAASGKRLPLEEAMEAVDQNIPLIVMDHRPTEFAAVEEAGVDLHLSGHTHAGQMFPVGKLGEWYGHSDQMYGHRQAGGFQSIVSSGVGTWGFSLRIGSRCEVVVVDLEG